MARSSTSSSKHSIKQQPDQDGGVIDDNASDTSHETAEHALFSHEGSDDGNYCGRKRWIIGGVLVMILVGIAVALGFTLHEGKHQLELTESSSNLRGSGATYPEDTTQEDTQADPSNGDDYRDIPETLLQPGKTIWPELFGMEVKQAEAIIKQERPDLDVVEVGVDQFVTSDYDTQRVWLWTDENGLVGRTPRVG